MAANTRVLIAPSLHDVEFEVIVVEGGRLMSVYHLHAYRFVGEPGAPDSEYERPTRETDDWAEAQTIAKHLVREGFDVIVYDHGYRTPLSGASDLREVAHYWENGETGFVDVVHWTGGPVRH